MTEFGDEDPEYADRIATYADTHRDAWSRTLEDMKALAAEREEEGWHVFHVAAGHTAPTHPDVREDGRYGFVHVIPGNFADDFVEAFEAGEFPKYQVYQKEVSGRMFMVTEFRDPDSKTSILIAGSYEMRNAPALVKKAQREGDMYTYVQKLDQTLLGTFKHDEYDRFFPDPEKYENYVVEAAVGVSGDEAPVEDDADADE